MQIMKNLQKGFVGPLVIAIIAVLAIGGGVYVYKNKKVKTLPVDTETQQTNTQTPPVNTQANNSSSQVDTSNWKTYTNTKQGYSFQYPKELYLDTSNTTVRLFRKVPYDFDLYVRIDPKKVDMPKNNWVYSAGSLNWKFDTTGNDVLSATIYYLPMAGNKTLIITKHELSDTKESEEMLNKILSTFKFTE